MTKTNTTAGAESAANASTPAETLTKAATEAEAAGTAAEEQKAEPAAKGDDAAAADTAEAVEKAERPQDKGGVVQGFQAKDGSFHLKKADALARNSEVDAEQVAAPAIEALKKLSDAVNKADGGEPEPKAEKVAEADAASKSDTPAADAAADDATAVEKAAPAEEMKKGMYDVSRFADMLQSILYLQQDTQWETEWERDDSELPAKLKAWLAEGGKLLVEMVGEETAELTAAKAAGGELEKKGAKLSAASKVHVEAMMKSAADHLDAMGKCYKGLGLGGQDDAEKMTKRADDTLLVENTALKKAFGEMTPKLEGLLKKFEEQNERIAHLESQPAPAKGTLRVVEKASDGGNVSDGDDVKKIGELTKGKTPEEVSKLLMKAALSNPQPVR